MSEFVAGAFVDVKPDTKGFREDLKKKVNSSISSAGVFKVPIQFEIKAFKKQLQDAARQAKPIIPIQVGGNVEELRKDINAKIKKATEGLTIKVPVEVTQTGAGSRGGTGGTGGTGGAGGAGGRGGTGGGSRKKLTDDERQALAVTKALDTAEAKLAATDLSLGRAQQSTLAVEERATLLREARTTANAAVRTTTQALATAEGSLTDQQKVALEVAQREALARRADVLAKEKAFKIDQASALATTKATAAREAAVAAMTVEVTSVTSLNELHILENELLATEAALKRTTNKARELGLTSLADENALLLTNIAERKEQIITQRAELKGEGQLARERKTGIRGIGATILSNLGLRGATLAATGSFLVGAAAATVFTKSLKSFADFETELNTFKAVAGATNDQMKTVSATAVQLGADITLPAVSASDAAQAMTELAKAGLSVQDSLAGARGVLELAAAAQIDNADAATLVASGLNAFGLAGDQAIHVADLLANAANAAQGSISEMGAALQQAAAIGHQVGVSLDDTVVLLTLLAKDGLRGSDAGTSLRTSFARLIAPTKKASDLLAQLNVNVRDVNGAVRPEFFADFAQATKELTPALRDMIAETIAGQDSIRAFSILGSEGARGLKLTRLEAAQTGTAAAVAAARTKGLGGQFSALSSNAETLGTKLGQVMAPAVENVTGDLNNLFTVLNKFSEGDFGGGLKDFLDFKGQETKQRLTGLKDIFSPRTGFEGKFKGFKELTGGVKGPKSAVDDLREQLDSLQKIRITAFSAGIPVGPITAQIQKIRDELKKAKADAGLLIPVTPLQKIKAPFQEAIHDAQEAKRALQEKTQTPAVIAQIASLDAIIRAATPKMRAAVRKFKDDANKEMTGLELAKRFDANFKAIAENADLATPQVIGSIDNLIAKIKNVPVGSAPVALGKKIIKHLQGAIDAAIAADDPDTAAAIKEKAVKIAALFGISLADAFKKIKVPLTSDDIANILLPDVIAEQRAEAFGTKADQLAAKQKHLADLNKQLGNVQKDSQQESDILGDIISVQGEIADLQKPSEATQAADTKVLDAISSKEQALQNKIAIAQTTKSLNDDLRAEKALRAFYSKQIAVVRATVKDKDQRNQAIADLRQKLFELDLDIAGTIKDRADRVFDDAAEAAQETETLADDLKVANRRVAFWKKQVGIVKDLVRKRKATAAELQAAQDSLDEAEKEAKKARRDRRQQQRENRQERLDLQIQIAQDNGNVKAEIKAREIQIKNTKDLIRQTRKGSLQRLRLIAQLRQEQKELRDLKGAKDDSTSAFELLQQSAGTFAQIADNLINSNMPFSDAGDFTHDQASVLTRRPKAAATGTGGGGAGTGPGTGVAGSAGVSRKSAAPPSTPAGVTGGAGGGVVDTTTSKEDDVLRNLIAALTANTEAINGKNSPKRTGRGGTGAKGQGDHRWVEAEQNRAKAGGAT